MFFNVEEVDPLDDESMDATHTATLTNKFKEGYHACTLYMYMYMYIHTCTLYTCMYIHILTSLGDTHYGNSVFMLCSGL